MYHVSAHDLAFVSKPVPCYSSAGVPYFRWMSTGMPKISRSLIKSTFFLFKDKAAASSGLHAGGTGSILSVPSEGVPDGAPYYYAVSCLHVIKDTPCVRINKRAGGTDEFDFATTQWTSDAELYGDVAVCMINPDGEVHDAFAIPVEMLLTRGQIDKHEIGVGENVFMVGLFLDEERRMNRQQNNPVARFGHVSMMTSPTALFNPENKLPSPREYFLLDLHSRTGFSGSPVFVFRTPDGDTTMPFGDLPASPESIIKLLGLHSGQFPEYWKWEEGQSKHESQSLKVEKAESWNRIRGLSGITFVAPAWDIAGLLFSEQMKDQRMKLDRQGRKPPNMLLESSPWRTGDGYTLMPELAHLNRTWIEVPADTSTFCPPPQ